MDQCFHTSVRRGSQQKGQMAGPTGGGKVARQVPGGCHDFEHPLLKHAELGALRARRRASRQSATPVSLAVRRPANVIQTPQRTRICQIVFTRHISRAHDICSVARNKRCFQISGDSCTSAFKTDALSQSDTRLLSRAAALPTSHQGGPALAAAEPHFGVLDHRCAVQQGATAPAAGAITGGAVTDDPATATAVFVKATKTGIVCVQCYCRTCKGEKLLRAGICK